MENKKKKKESEELLKNKKVEGSPLKEVIEFEDDETILIQDSPDVKLKK
jgi:hypothetical protein